MDGLFEMHSINNSPYFSSWIQCPIRCDDLHLWFASIYPINLNTWMKINIKIENRLPYLVLFPLVFGKVEPFPPGPLLPDCRLYLLCDLGFSGAPKGSGTPGASRLDHSFAGCKGGTPYSVYTVKSPYIRFISALFSSMKLSILSLEICFITSISSTC